MSERYDPRKLVRERAGKEPVPEKPAIDSHQEYLRRRRDRKLGGAPVLCRHGVPWTECAIDSKRVR